eukprot:CAMPEP_0184716512 /NCGR_PEP_ID=MMETSP0314-20130426/6237_1 /TAXON_ID=38298 /ORGANISM="Rhodella maculata, Strain CCMP 736" /LENGTH=274 /DNA_ID=CAMNT_0027179933 /DNA_START=789 /DNA_END=1614 /DNA_ORIENTATION=-
MPLPPARTWRPRPSQPRLVFAQAPAGENRALVGAIRGRIFRHGEEGGRIGIAGGDAGLVEVQWGAEESFPGEVGEGADGWGEYRLDEFALEDGVAGGAKHVAAEVEEAGGRGDGGGGSGGGCGIVQEGCASVGGVFTFDKDVPAEHHDLRKVRVPVAGARNPREVARFEGRGAHADDPAGVAELAAAGVAGDGEGENGRDGRRGVRGEDHDGTLVDHVAVVEAVLESDLGGGGVDPFEDDAEEFTRARHFADRAGQGKVIGGWRDGWGYEGAGV